MKKFDILADTTSDLKKSWYIANDAQYAKHAYVIDGEEVWDDCGNVDPQDIFRRIRAGEKPSTIQVKLEDFVDIFTNSCKNGLDIIYVGFSSALSGTYATSQMAAKMVMETYPERRVICIDSVAATMGQGILVMEAVRLRDQGMSAEEAGKILEEKKYQVCHYFTVDDLNHLYRGGRLSKTSAVVGTLMGIKPVMYLNEEGRLAPISKARGRKASMQELVKLVKEHIVEPLAQTIYVAHGDVEDEAAELGKMMEAAIPGAKIEINQLSPIIGIHSGPGTLAVFCWGDKRL